MNLVLKLAPSDMKKYQPNFYKKNVILYKILSPRGCHIPVNGKRDRDGYIIVRKNRKDIKLHRLI